MTPQGRKLISDLTNQVWPDIPLRRKRALEARENGRPNLTCKCGKEVKFTMEIRCEDCYAWSMRFYHGHSQRVKIERTG